MRRHNDKINKPVTINDLIVYPTDSSVKGEFNQSQWQNTGQPQEDRIARMTAEIRRLADFAVANHTQTSAGNNVTRIATPEFFFYTNPPLSQEEYSTLVQNIETMAAQLPQDIHMILGSFHLEHTSGALLNSTIHVQAGPQPEINVFAKNSRAQADMAPKEREPFQQNPYFNNFLEIEPKSFTSTEDSSVISSYPLINCTTASGAEFITAVDICLDHKMALARKILINTVSTQDGLMPVHCNHVIVSSSIKKQDHAQITEGHTVHHVDACPKHMLDARNLERFNHAVQMNVPDGLSRGSDTEVTVESPAFGAAYHIRRYRPEQVAKFSPEFLSGVRESNSRPVDTAPRKRKFPYEQNSQYKFCKYDNAIPIDINQNQIPYTQYIGALEKEPLEGLYVPYSTFNSPTDDEVAVAQITRWLEADYMPNCPRADAAEPSVSFQGQEVQKCYFELKPVDYTILDEFLRGASEEVDHL